MELGTGRLRLLDNPQTLVAGNHRRLPSQDLACPILERLRKESLALHLATPLLQRLVEVLPMHPRQAEGLQLRAREDRAPLLLRLPARRLALLDGLWLGRQQVEEDPRLELLLPPLVEALAVEQQPLVEA